MLDVDTRRRIDTARDILVGKLPDPKSQVEQITIALIYKFMDDMDREAVELGGKAKFFTGEYQRYAWTKIFDPSLSGYELVNVYGEAVQKMNQNPNIPQLFRDIFKNAFLPYRDPETLKSFLKIINDFEYDLSEKLGDAFEYLLSVLGSQGEAGQFRTPRHIIDFMVAIVDPKKNESILDPACGTAGFLISSYKHILKHNSENFDPERDPSAFELHGVRLEEITINTKRYSGDKLTSDDKERLVKNIIGYDISPDMVRLSQVNMYLHGFSNPRIFEYDTLTSEEKWNEYADVIMANPPFMSPKGGIRPHKRFSIQSSRSEVLFVDYIAEHLTPQGRAAVIVPEGIIFQTQTAHRNLRKMLIEKNYLVGVISLPAGVFNPYSGVKTSVLWMDRTLAKKTDKLLFVKIENDGFDLGAQRRPIKQNDLPNAFRAIQEYKKSFDNGKDFDLDKWQDVLIVQKSKIAENDDYNLAVERYKPTQIFTKQKWPMVKLDEVIDTITPPIKILKTHFGESGKYPIIDQSKNNIAGWTNDEDAVVKIAGPVVIFGDHTCSIKYSEVPFAQGADGIKIIRTDHRLLPKFLYFCLRTKRIESAGYKRHFSKLKETIIPLPPLQVQEQIVTELSGYQKIIDGARQVVDNYKPHIHIDPSWSTVELGEVADFKRGPFGGSLKREIFVDSGYCVYEQSHAIDNDFANVRYFITSQKFEEMKQFEVKPGELIMSCSGTMGRIAIVPENVKPGIINQALLKLMPSERINNLYLKHIMESDTFQSALHNLTYGSAIKNVASVSVLRQIKIPLPDLQIQKRIVEQLEEEHQLVNANKRLLETFEQKIRDCIASVWGDK